MSALLQHVHDYLRLRRAMGFKLHREAVVLPQFVKYVESSGADVVTSDLAIEWARLSPSGQPITWTHRLIAVRGFARYLRTIVPATEIPPCGIFPRPPQRPAPFLFSPQDISRLVEAAGGLRPTNRAVTIQTLLGLLAVTGMRIGEALALTREHADLESGVLTVAGSKNGHTRLLPLHPSSTNALLSYTRCRDQWFPTPRCDAFFVSAKGTPLIHHPVNETFHELTAAIGIRTATVKPRIHDLRHSFTVSCLLNWYRAGADVAARMATLSTYLGHINPAGTYWYLSATPELMALAAQRLDTPSGGRQ